MVRDSESLPIRMIVLTYDQTLSVALLLPGAADPLLALRFVSVVPDLLVTGVAVDDGLLLRCAESGSNLGRSPCSTDVVAHGISILLGIELR